MTINCEVCNKKVEVRAFWQKFCSSKCRLIGWAIKQKDVKNKSVKESR